MGWYGWPDVPVEGELGDELVGNCPSVISLAVYEAGVFFVAFLYS
jgi:hypothetical protein